MKIREIVDPMDNLGFMRNFAFDTTFVLFFLALEFGRTVESFTFDAVLLLITMLMVIVLPYFVTSDAGRCGFVRWLGGRSSIALFAVLLGFAFSQTIGTVLPEALRFLPMTLLILAAMLGCLVQFYGLTRPRLAK